jgi:hypothetical protein
MITTEDYTNGACYSIEKLTGKNISEEGLNKLCSVYSGIHCSYIGLNDTYTHNVMDAKIYRVSTIINDIKGFKNYSIRLFLDGFLVANLLVQENKTPLQCLLEKI